MATLFHSSNNLILSVKVSLVSVTVLSMAIAFKIYLPLICEFVISEFPLALDSLRSWLTPPYLYVVINFMILIIAASSRFQTKVDEEVEATTPEPVKISLEFHRDFIVSPVYDEPVVLKVPVELQPKVTSVSDVLMPEDGAVLDVEEYKQENLINEGEEIVAPGSKETLIRTESMDHSFSKDRPPVSARFSHRKITKGNTEGGKTLGVTKPKRQETLESTWKMITEGRSMPLARHLKKSETWETNQNPGEPHEQMKKTETFNSQTNVSSTLTPSQGSGSGSGSGGKLRKEPSLSQDDLNRRVEAFINKFNEEMRLQRLESLTRYKETMNRGPNFET